MKANLAVLLVALSVVVFPLFLFADGAEPASVPPSAAQAMAKLPLSFEPTGAPEVYVARAGGYTVSVMPRQTEVTISEHSGTSAAAHSVYLTLEGANATSKIEPIDPLPGVTNYYLGRNPRDWRLGVRNYARLRTKEVYPGVDMVYYGDHRRLEFDLVVAPGANPRPISLAFSGTDRVYMSGEGDLVADVNGHEVRFAKPVAYQRIAGEMKPVNVDYALMGNAKVQLRIGDYDRNSELVIDPVVTFATYLGGGQGEVANGIAVDKTGNVFVAGQTCSPTFPGATTSLVNCNAFVTELNPTGSQIIYTTIIGGTDSGVPAFGTTATAIALDPAGTVYISGTTNSKKLPVNTTLTLPGPTTKPNAYFGGDSDAFIGEIAPGGALQRVAYLGGSGSDSGLGVAVDAATPPNVIIVGQSCLTPYVTPDFPAYAGFERKVEYCVAFVTKLNNALDIFVPGPNGSWGDQPPNYGNQFFFSEYFGGLPRVPESFWQPSHNYYVTDMIQGQWTDDKGNVGWHAYECIKSGTSAPVYPNPTGEPIWPWQTNAQLKDGTVTWVDVGAPQALVYASTVANAVAVDPLGDIFVAGASDTDFIVGPDGAGLSYYDGRGAWVLKVNSMGDWVYSTHLGKTKSDSANAVAVDPYGRVYIVGTSTGGIFVTGGFQAAGGGQDAFIMRFNTTDSQIEYASYLGGSGDDRGLGVAVDVNGAAYVTGSTSSANFPIYNPLINPLSVPPNIPMGALSGPEDAFVTKITPDGTAVVFSTYLGGTGPDRGKAIAVRANATAPDDIYVTGVTYSSDFPVYPAAAPLPVQQNYVDNGDAFVVLIPGASTPMVSVKPEKLGFSPQAAGSTSAAQPVTYTNLGNAPVTISGSTITGDFQATDNCPVSRSVAAGANCTFSVTFTPTASGSRTGVLTITDNSGDPPHTINLAGTGTVATVTPVTPPGTGGGTGGGGTGGTVGSGGTGGSGASADFSVAGPATPTAVTRGTPATFQITVTPVGGFAQTVALTCSAPSPATCSISPATVALSGTSAAQAIATISAPASSSSSSTSRSASKGHGDPWKAIMPLSVLGLALIGKRRRVWLVLLLLVLCVAMMSIGCGKGSSSSSSSMQPGSYNFMVTGTYSPSGGAPVTHTISVPVQVN
jgi:hypothetical protein